MSRSLAISFSDFQKASSRLTLVLWPAITTERLTTKDFIAPLFSFRTYNAAPLLSGGSQLVRVEHVHVNEGGQAVIGPTETAKAKWQAKRGAGRATGGGANTTRIRPGLAWYEQTIVESALGAMLIIHEGRITYAAIPRPASG